MRIFLLIFIFSFSSGILFAQHKEDAGKLVNEGIVLEDSGRSDEAIEKYQQALEMDKNNLQALAEMSYSLLTLKKYDEAVKYCKTAIRTHPGEPELKMVYVSYGTAYDGLKKHQKSIDVYDEGIKLFPDYFYLYYNKGITYWEIENLDEALFCFQKSAVLNPNHPGSQNGIGKICMTQNKKIPAIMAYCRLLVLEPESERSAIALENIQKIMSASVKDSGSNHITISVTPEMLDTGNEKQKMNNFSAVELNLALASALDYDSSVINKSNVLKFLRKLDVVCENLKAFEKDNYGFYWDYYAPYYIEMKQKDLTKTCAYIAFASSGDPVVTAWLSIHQSEIGEFFKWATNFKWKIN